MVDALRLTCCLAIACVLVSTPQAAGLDGYLTGEMAKLRLIEPPVSLTAHQVTYPDGDDRTLEEKKGKVLLVNLWAKWCVPCKEEMQDFASLQRDLGGDMFEVVALPMKKRSIGSVRKILKNWGAENLQPYGNDPKALASVLYKEGLFTERKISFVYPTTYLVNKDGAIVAVREGFLKWDTPEARSLIKVLMSEEP